MFINHCWSWQPFSVVDWKETLWWFETARRPVIQDRAQVSWWKQEKSLLRFQNTWIQARSVLKLEIARNKTASSSDIPSFQRQIVMLGLYILVGRQKATVWKSTRIKTVRLHSHGPILDLNSICLAHSVIFPIQLLWIFRGSRYNQRITTNATSRSGSYESVNLHHAFTLFSVEEPAIATSATATRKLPLSTVYTIGGLAFGTVLMAMGIVFLAICCRRDSQKDKLKEMQVQRVQSISRTLSSRKKPGKRVIR